MTIEISLVDEVLDILHLANMTKDDVDYDSIINWLYANTDRIAGFMVGKYRTGDLVATDGEMSYEDMAELILEKL